MRAPIPSGQRKRCAPGIRRTGRFACRVQRRQGGTIRDRFDAALRLRPVFCAAGRVSEPSHGGMDKLASCQGGHLRCEGCIERRRSLKQNAARLLDYRRLCDEAMRHGDGWSAAIR
jgi:hypothetical protein